MQNRLLYLKGIAVGIILLGCAAAAGWYGPWNAENRYNHTGLLGLRLLVDREPDNALAWHVMALRLAKDGDGELAEPALRQAVALNPKDADAATALAEILMATNRYPEAFQILKSATALQPQNMLAHLTLGKLYRTKGSAHHAADEFKAALANEPNADDIWYLLAETYLNMQQSAKAEDAIAHALRISPDNPRYLALQGNMKAATGQIDEGIALANKAVAAAPQDSQTLSNLINLLLLHHRNDQDLQLAEQTLDKLEQIDPRMPLLPYQRGQLEQIRQRWDASARYYERALQTVPEMDKTYFALSQVYRRLHRDADAEKMQIDYLHRQALRRQINDIHMALDSHPQDVSLYEKLALKQAQTRDLKGAIASLQAALEIDPKSVKNRQRLQFLQRQGSVPTVNGQ